MAHYANCERAQSRQCRCTMCWGTQHGWKEAVKLAKDADPAGRQELRSKVEQTWRATVEDQKPGDQRRSERITYPKKIAGVDSALADLVDWLAHDLTAGELANHHGSSRLSRSPDAPGSNTATAMPPTGAEAATAPTSPGDQPQQQDTPTLTGPVVAQVEQLGNKLADEVLRDIEKAYGKPVPRAVKTALADHFWCDLLAQFAHVIDIGVKFLDNIPDRVTELILKSRAESKRLPLEEFVVKVAVKSAWKTLQGLTLFGVVAQVRKFLPVIRILAILICKAPERHRAVTEYCIDPLKDQLTAETKRRLLKVLRAWLPQIASEVGNDAIDPLAPGRPDRITGSLIS